MDVKEEQTETVDGYISQFPTSIQQILSQIRAAIRETAPGAEERIRYHMPAYYLNGNLVYFSVHKHHIGFYPLTAGMLTAIPELAAYKGAKAAVHFPLDKPVPYDLIRKMVAVRVAENRNSD